jgi:radical SAM protein with 4Fe4S-binding SPASM domain
MKRYCSAPWHGLHINPRGDVKTCCAGDPNLLGNLNTHTVDEMLNGDVMREVRQYMKQGQLHPEYCKNCLNGSGEIDWHNNTNENFNYEDAPLEYLYPTIVDARWNITCNQSCNYCDANASSSWAAITGSMYKPETRKRTDEIIELIDQNKNKIVEVALVGGEPLLLKENLAVLDALEGTNCKVVIITNLNVDLESNAVFQKLKKHPRVGWSLSFDNIGPEYEYVRYGGSWELHEKNIDTVCELMKHGHDGGIHAVYNLYNCTKLVEFKEWAASKGLSIIWQRLFTPSHLDVHNQNQSIKDLALAEIDRMFEECEITEFEQNFFHQIQAELQSSKGYADPIAFTKQMETQYHPDTQGHFGKLWPEIYNALSK